MKGKWYIGGIMAFIVVLFAAFFMFFDKKIEAYAASAVFIDQPFNAYFSGGVKESSITEGKIYVVDKATDKKVDATISLNDSKNMIIVSGLKIGSYTLHVKKDAFTKVSVRNTDKVVEFNVVDQIQHVTSVEDLKTYFETVLNFENERYAERFMETFSSSKEESATMDSSANSGGSRHSTTNNQVEGIEEGDIVVTDGRYIYSIAENQLVITDASNPNNMKVVTKKAFKENAYATNLMLHGKLLVVTYESYEERPVKGQDYMHHMALSKFAFYNVSNAKDPQLVREIGQEGMLAGVRKSGNVLYMVTNTTPNYWMLRDKVNVELRPFVFDSKQENVAKPMPIEKITILPNSSEPNYTILSAIDLTDFAKNEVKTTSYLGSSSQIYMSHNAIYVTAPKYDYVKEQSANKLIADRMIMMPSIIDTQIYKFSIQNTAIKMTAEATVKGTILNQFSMDEYDGYFRVATTEGNAWGNNVNSKNHLFVLDQNLHQVGSLTDLARGERIYSARFMGDKAYIVTFKQVDPLFVIDVANPANPKVLGELKIPGFSNYLHPLDDKHLIGIGYDTQVRIDSYSKEPFVITKGMKLALFDVSDLANPKEKDAVIIGGRGTYSDVQYDHKALFRDIDNNYYGFPITIYTDKGEFDSEYKGTGSQIYEITTKGIKLKADLVTRAKVGEQYEEWEKVVRRMIYIDDALYTVSQGEIVSYDLKTFKKLDSVLLK